MKSDLYKHLIQEHRDSDGFIYHKECDSLLFSGLLGCLPDFHVNIDAAFDGTLWHRRSLQHPKCFVCGEEGNGSASSISRDMLVGLAWYCWHNQRGDIAEHVVEYALRNQGFMGEANEFKVKWGRTQILPGLLATFAIIAHKLTDRNYWWAYMIPADMGSQIDDYGAHLQVLHIILRRQLVGWNWWFEKSILKWQAKRRPENPLYRIAVGDFSQVLAILGKEEWWPSDRLPTSRDRKTHSIQMREPKDWKPDPRKTIHTHCGDDYLFCEWLIEEEIKRRK